MSRSKHRLAKLPERDGRGNCNGPFGARPHHHDPARLPPTAINPELSLLAFQRRVLALAEDPSTPLVERLRFLGIVTSNIDELYMVRMAELRRAAVDDHATAELQEVETTIRSLLSAQARCAANCLVAARALGTEILSWDALTGAERAALSERYRQEIHPDLVSHAITLSPGYPLPYLPHLGLFVAVAFREGGAVGRARVAEHEVPRDVPRLFPVPGRTRAVIAMEDVLRANVHQLYPDAQVDGAWLFRVTRGGDLPLQEDDSARLIDQVARATERRPQNPAVRVEVERTLPPEIGALILESLRREAVGRDMELTVREVQVVDGLLDLRCLAQLPLPPDARLEYPPFTARTPAANVSSIWDWIAAEDRLCHHPFDAFDDTVVRFFERAADDPAVEEIHATLYRVGNPSPIVQALLRAASRGARVSVVVELQARFDEEHNVHWARTLERAGGRVVYGIPGLKVHAKAALVTRRTTEGVVRYAHVGTGNYNPRTARQYTDLSLFTMRAPIVKSVRRLFDALLAGKTPSVDVDDGALIAPEQLLPALLQRIAREAKHARSGRAATITIKVNGLADNELIAALEGAAAAGVRIQLIVRGLCTLRPSAANDTQAIAVRSVVGRFLEHSRV
jgi:polyphosphate kinase